MVVGRSSSLSQLSGTATETEAVNREVIDAEFSAIIGPVESEQIAHGLLHAHCFDMYTLISFLFVINFVPVYGMLFTFGAFALPLPSTYYSESL